MTTARRRDQHPPSVIVRAAIEASELTARYGATTAISATIDDLDYHQECPVNRTPATTDTSTPAKVGTIALWVFQIALAALFVVNFGPGKVMGSEQAVQTFADIGVGQWLRYLTGTLEIVLGLGLLLPRVSGFAALGLTGVMAGAVLAEVFLLEADVLVPLILLICVAVIAWFRRDDTLALVGRLRALSLPTGR